MRIIFVTTTLLIGFCFTGFAQEGNITVDFFYGTWLDSTKTGLTLTREKQLFLYPKREKKGLEDLDYYPDELHIQHII